MSRCSSVFFLVFCLGLHLWAFAESRILCSCVGAVRLATRYRFSNFDAVVSAPCENSKAPLDGTLGSELAVVTDGSREQCPHAWASSFVFCSHLCAFSPGLPRDGVEPRFLGVVAPCVDGVHCVSKLLRFVSRHSNAPCLNDIAGRLYFGTSSRSSDSLLAAGRFRIGPTCTWKRWYCHNIMLESLSKSNV